MFEASSVDGEGFPPLDQSTIDGLALYGLYAHPQINYCPYLDFWVNTISEGLNVAGTNVVSVVIPEDLGYIGTYAFKGCTSLTHVTIPNSVHTIEAGAFHDCTALTDVIAPSPEKCQINIQEGGIFRGCTSLQRITVLEYYHQSEELAKFFGIEHKVTWN